MTDDHGRQEHSGGWVEGGTSGQTISTFGIISVTFHLPHRKPTARFRREMKISHSNRTENTAAVPCHTTRDPLAAINVNALPYVISTPRHRTICEPRS